MFALMTTRRGWRAALVGAALTSAALLPIATGHNPATAAGIGPLVLAFGDATAPGDPTTLRPAKPIVGMASTPDGGGYWLVASDGGIFALGNARFHGSAGNLTLARPIVGMAATPDGGGYWLVASDGGIFGYGNARFHGSTGGIALNRPIVGMARTNNGGGYWLVASDGGIFAFGNAGFHGSTGGIALNKPVVGMAASPSGGYWLVATDGGVFAYGGAPFHGSTGGTALNRPIVGMTPRPDGTGYWMIANDGGLFAFGKAGFYGSAVGRLGAGRVAAGMVRSASGNGYRILGVPSTLRVGFAGDVHGVGRVANTLANGHNPLAPMSPFFRANDVNIVNLETAVGSSGSPAVKQYTFQSPPTLLAALRDGGAHVMNLANNHILDYGTGAMLETIDSVRRAGLHPVGAGADAAQAYAPAILSTPAGSVAVIGLSQVVQAGWASGPGRPGVASAYDVSAATNAVRNARTRADHVVVMVHWGEENHDCPNSKQTNLAAALLQAGAEVVAGNHPHRLQGITAANGRLVHYSGGNFIWYNNSSPNDLTGLLTVELGEGGVRRHEFAPARIDNMGRPIPLTGQAAADVRARLDSLTPGGPGPC